MNQNYGNIPQQSLKLTKTVVVDALKAYLGLHPNALVDYYDDRKPKTRHCCLGEPGIKHLSVSQWQYSCEDGKLIIVEYFVCPRCHRLLVYRDFM